jgi:hypothetical protein
MGPYAGVDNNLTPTHLPWATLCQSRLLPLDKDLIFGLSSNNFLGRVLALQGYVTYVVVNRSLQDCYLLKLSDHLVLAL